MKKAVIVFVAMTLVVLLSVGSLSAAFVYPGGYVRYYSSIFKDKTTTTGIFNGQPDTSGVYSYAIRATVMNGDTALVTTKRSASGILYPLSQRAYSKSASAYNGSHGLGIVQFETSTHGNFGHFWYAY